MINKIYFSHISLLLSLAFSSLVFLSSCSQEKPKELNVGDLVPSFSAQSLQGHTINLAQFTGKPVIIRFFTKDCRYCRVDTSVFNTFYDQYKEQGLQIIYINTDENSEGLDAFVEGLGIQFPVILDPEHVIADSYKVTKVPLAFVLNPKHTVSGVLLGGVGEGELHELLEGSITKQ